MKTSGPREKLLAALLARRPNSDGATRGGGPEGDGRRDGRGARRSLSREPCRMRRGTDRGPAARSLAAPCGRGGVVTFLDLLLRVAAERRIDLRTNEESEKRGLSSLSSPFARVSDDPVRRFGVPHARSTPTSAATCNTSTVGAGAWPPCSPTTRPSTLAASAASASSTDGNCCRDLPRG